ncbi:MAG: serine hydrolase domain-containing protein [Thermodesulfobacteriota bacterium]
MRFTHPEKALKPHNRHPRKRPGMARLIPIAALLIGILVCFLPAPAISGDQLPEDIAGRLDQAMTEAVQAQPIPGAVAGVVRISDGARWTRAQGLAEVDNIEAPPADWSGNQMTLNRHFRIASLTKTFTATLIVKLIDAGLVDFDDTVADWLPGLVDNGASITVKQLLNMTSGLAEYTTEEFNVFTGDHPDTVWQPRELARIADGQNERFEGAGKVFDRDHFSYRNTNYVLLGMIAEKATGKTYAELIRNRVTDPMGLSDTYAARNADIQAPACRGYFNNDEGWSDVTAVHPSYVWSAGAIVSTLGDILNWGRALTRGAVQPPGLWRKRLQLVPAPYEDCRFSYGLGLFFKGGAVGHNGTVLGYQSSCYRYRGYLVAALTNCALATTDTDHTADAITDALMTALTGTRPRPCDQDLESGLTETLYQPSDTTANLTSSHARSWENRAPEMQYVLPDTSLPASRIHRFSAALSAGRVLVFRARWENPTAKPLARLELMTLKAGTAARAFGGYDEPGIADSGNWWVTKASDAQQILSETERLSAETVYDLYFVVQDNGGRDVDPADGLVETSVIVAENTLGPSGDDDPAACYVNAVRKDP